MTRAISIVGSVDRAGVVDRGPWTVDRECRGEVGTSDRLAVNLALRPNGADASIFAPKGDLEALAYALAAGAQRVGFWKDADDCAFDVALVGAGALAALGEVFAGSLAERCGATLVFDVLSVERSGQQMVVVKDIGKGCREELWVEGRAVLVISSMASPGPYISRYRLNKGAKQCRELGLCGDEEGLERIGVDWQAVRPRARLGQHQKLLEGQVQSRLDSAFGLAGSPASNTSHMIEADPETCAQHLVRYLAHHNLLPCLEGDGVQTAVDTFPLTKGEPKGVPRLVEMSVGVNVQNASSTATLSQQSVPRQFARRPRLDGAPLERSNRNIARGPRPVD